MLSSEEIKPGSKDPGPEPVPWTLIAWCTGLLIVSYFPILKRMAEQWSNDDDMGHGFFVPLVAIYIAWQRKDELAAIVRRPHWLGVVLLVWGAIQMSIGILGAELFLQRSAFVISVVGSVLLLGGFPVVKRLAFPLTLLIFMIPLPAVIYNQVTFPLQLLASTVAEVALSLIGIPVLRDGNVLELASQKLSVVEACSGIRSLLSLSFLSLVYGYFFEDRGWMRLALFISTIPIAIAANSFRVSLTGVLSEWNPDLAQGFFHSLEGWVIFVFALMLLVLTHSLLKRLASMVESKPAAVAV